MLGLRFKVGYIFDLLVGDKNPSGTKVFYLFIVLNFTVYIFCYISNMLPGSVPY